MVGFEDEQDARQFLAELRGRFAKFGLELHPDKTRLIEFGRHAGWKRAKRGLGKPETFDFWAPRDDGLPPVRILHPFPEERFAART